MERIILIAAIYSTAYLRQIRQSITTQYFEARTARLLVTWVLEYFDKYNRAPGKQIHDIYMDKLKTSNMDEELAAEIEEDLLPGLYKQFKKKGIDVKYLIDISNKYFVERKLKLHVDEIEGLLEKGDIEEAEKSAADFKQIEENVFDIDLSSKEALKRVQIAFEQQGEVLLKYPGVLGEFWNSQMVRGGFVGLMAAEKRGKTFQLIDMALRGTKQGRKVAFFQAGDMTEGQQIRRICINLTRTSDKQKFVGLQYVPVKDCIHNQLDTCDKKIRESNFGIFDESSYAEKGLRDGINFDDLLQAYGENGDYKPCYNCVKYKSQRWGTPWLKEINIPNVLTVEMAQHAITKFYIQSKRSFKLSSHANGTLSVQKIESILNRWEEKDNFVADIIIVDYADLLVGSSGTEFRHSQNEIWKRLRGLSQSKNALVITATQTDASSYERHTLSLKNFSEDKRKYAHVTGMYGLNQDKEGREKKIGMLRINELVVREDEFDIKRQVVVLQKLAQGRPFLTSYWY